MNKKIFVVLFLFLIGTVFVISERQPAYNSDTNLWGDILNSFLNVTFTENGTIKAGTNASFYNLNASNEMYLEFLTSENCVGTDSDGKLQTGTCGGGDTNDLDIVNASMLDNKTIVRIINVTGDNITFFNGKLSINKSFTLDIIGDPLTDADFDYGNAGITHTFAAPTSNAFDIEATGGFQGDLLHIHQHTGNPSDTTLLHLHADDEDVRPLVVNGTNPTAILVPYGNMTMMVGGVYATDWNNVTITESQVTDLTHTVESDPIYTPLNGSILFTWNLTDISLYINGTLNSSLYNLSVSLVDYFTQSFIYTHIDNNITSANDSMRTYISEVNTSMKDYIDNGTYNKSIDLSGYISDASLYRNINDFRIENISNTTYIEAISDITDFNTSIANYVIEVNASMRTYISEVNESMRDYLDNGTYNKSVDLSGYSTGSHTVDTDTRATTEQIIGNFTNSSYVNVTMCNGKICININVSNDLCVALTGASGLCDGTDDTAAGGFPETEHYTQNISSYMGNNNASRITVDNASWAIETVNDSINTYYNHSITCPELTGSADLCDGTDDTAAVDTNELDIANVSMLDNASILRPINFSDISYYINQTINISLYNLSVSLGDYYTQSIIYTHINNNLTSANASFKSYITDVNASIISYITEVNQSMRDYIDNGTYNKSIDLSGYISDATAYQKVDDIYQDLNFTHSLGNITGDNISFADGKLWVNISFTTSLNDYYTQSDIYTHINNNITSANASMRTYISEVNTSMKDYIDNGTYNKSIDLSGYISDASAYQKIVDIWNGDNATNYMGGTNSSRILDTNSTWWHKFYADTGYKLINFTSDYATEYASTGFKIANSTSNYNAQLASNISGGHLLTPVNLTDISIYINETSNASLYNLSVGLEDYFTQSITYTHINNNITSANASSKSYIDVQDSVFIINSSDVRFNNLTITNTNTTFGTVTIIQSNSTCGGLQFGAGGLLLSCE